MKAHDFENPEPRKMSKSDVVRERLQGARRPGRGRRGIPIVGIADLICSVDGLPSDLSTRKKADLKSTRYGERVLVDAAAVRAEGGSNRPP